MRSKSGVSLVEAVIVLVVLGLVLLIALPSLARARARVELMVAGESFAALHALARQISVQYGRISRLHFDPAGGRAWVTVDTSSQGVWEVLDTVGQVVLGGAGVGAGVRLEGTPRTFCFDPRGLGTARADCDLPNGTLVFRCGTLADTMTISRLGRLLWR